MVQLLTTSIFLSILIVIIHLLQCKGCNNYIWIYDYII